MRGEIGIGDEDLPMAYCLLLSLETGDELLLLEFGALIAYGLPREGASTKFDWTFACLLSLLVPTGDERHRTALTQRGCCEVIWREEALSIGGRRDVYPPHSPNTSSSSLLSIASKSSLTMGRLLRSYYFSIIARYCFFQVYK